MFGYTGLAPRVLNAFVGFEEIKIHVDDLMDRIHTSTSNAFPPYNVRKLDENRYAIEIAVAGYSIGELDITVNEDLLTIRATPGKEVEGTLLYQGMTRKNWLRDFVISDGVTIKGADLVNGLLKIELERAVPKKAKCFKINIGAPTAKDSPQLLNEDSTL